ncbi:type II toxin-antitoxin system RelE/ParE family toxin [uncultured Campylobacter sp.]|uniref:type II toxin-antitoxin system RelE/ParE family toxin n=1 Tax=uncultured Campylobacter sp. TaxID=218934 RepID=UPI0026034256|nr:type II toxin-antitoxin system RelE/ParE family toxin [uncultured Campylobacter sp.]
MEVKYTKHFEKWLRSLSDYKAKALVLRRIDKIKNSGHFGDYKSVTNATDIYELRIFVSGGIRIYFTFKGYTLIILLCGGDKSTQARDIEKAKEILKEL